MDLNVFCVITLILLVVIFLLVLGILLLMVSLFRQQQERIARLESLLARGQPAPTFVDGKNRLLTGATGYVDHAGSVRLNSDHNLAAEFAGMPVFIYVVAEG